MNILSKFQHPSSSGLGLRVYNDSIAALIVVKQLWPQRNLSPRGWVILAAPALGRCPPLRKRVWAWQSDCFCLSPPLPPSRNQRTVPFPLPLLGRVCTRGIECDSMVSVGPSALRCVVPRHNLVSQLPILPPTTSSGAQKGFN